MVYHVHEIGNAAVQLLKDRVPSAPAVVSGLRVTVAVVVIQHQMLALIPDNVGNALKITRMLSDNERARVERDNHSRCIDIPALVIVGSRILCRTDSDVGRVLTGAALNAVSLSYIYSVIGIIQLASVPILP